MFSHEARVKTYLSCVLLERREISRKTVAVIQANAHDEHLLFREIVRHDQANKREAPRSCCSAVAETFEWRGGITSDFRLAEIICE